MFEDSPSKVNSLKKILELKLKHQLNFNLEIIDRTDEEFLETDLLTSNYHIILVDDDLGGSWGSSVIEKIIEICNDFPEARNIPIIYYSAGTSISDLKNKIGIKYNIPCLDFNDVEDYVFKMIKIKFG